MDSNKVIKVAMLGAGTVGGGVYKLLKMRQDEMYDKMEAGEAAIGVYYAGDSLTMIDNNPDLNFVIPKKGNP